MNAQRTGEVVKAHLPQHSIAEQALDENHFGALPDLLLDAGCVTAIFLGSILLHDNSPRLSVLSVKSGQGTF